MFAQPIIQQSIAQIGFWLSFALIVYIYLGYPVLMFLLSKLFPRPVRRAPITPRISVIIAAHNEEQSIAQKIENTLALDYPVEKFEVIVASDSSSDGTDAIVKGYADRGVILFRQEEHLGKTYAQNHAVKVSSGEILVFSDATTMYEPDVLRKIVCSFADSTVGCVAGQLVYVDDKVSPIGKGCRSYWNYEKLLKQFESHHGSLVGVSGCLYAVRRSCHAKLASDMIDDFVIATEIHRQGLRTIYDPEAISKEDTNHRSKDEFRMRVRVIEQTMSALYRYREVLNPMKHGMFAFQMISHKVLRYTVPLCLFVAFIASWLARDAGGIYLTAFIIQAVCYTTALAGWIGDRAKIKLGPLALSYYFVLVNVASLFAFLKFMRGESHVVWEPVREAPAGGFGNTAVGSHWPQDTEH